MKWQKLDKHDAVSATMLALGVIIPMMMVVKGLQGWRENAKHDEAISANMIIHYSSTTGRLLMVSAIIAALFAIIMLWADPVLITLSGAWALLGAGIPGNELQLNMHVGAYGIAVLAIVGGLIYPVYKRITDPTPPLGQVRHHGRARSSN